MNHYILYHQEKSESLVKLQVTCRDVYEVIAEAKTAQATYEQITELMGSRQTFAIIDPNGAVIAADLAIKRCSLDKKDGRLAIEIFQLKRVLTS